MSVSVDPAISMEVEKLLERTGALLNGHFKLSSGLHSDRYCQCAKLFEDPAAGGMVAKLMRDTLPRKLRIDVVLAPALGGVIWGYELARAYGARSLFAERKDGEFELRRGFELREGEHVLLAEDVITTGKSVKELLPLIQDAGAIAVGFAAVVDRSRGTFDPGQNREGKPIGAWALCELHFNTWPAEECPLVKAGIPVEKPGSRPG